MRRLIQVELLNKGYRISLFNPNKDKIEKIETLRADRKDLFSLLDYYIPRSEDEVVKKKLFLCPFKVGEKVRTTKEWEEKHNIVEGIVEDIKIYRGSTPFSLRVKEKNGSSGWINAYWLKDSGKLIEEDEGWECFYEDF